MYNKLTININGVEHAIEYSKNQNHHVLGLYERPFNAIKNGTKKVEVRTNTPHSPFDYFKIKESDVIEFLNEQTGETILTKVRRIAKYSSARKLLETEGTENVLSSGADLEQGVKNLNSLTGYAENIPKHGVLAIEIFVV